MPRCAVVYDSSSHDVCLCFLLDDLVTGLLVLLLLGLWGLGLRGLGLRGPGRLGLLLWGNEC